MKTNMRVSLQLRLLPPLPRRRSLLLFALLLSHMNLSVAAPPAEQLQETAAAEPATETAAPIVAAIQRSLALLETASSGSAEQRKCFTCHSQAHPVIALAEARRRGFTIDQENFDRQIQHTAAHLDRGRSDYLEGRGQGGKSDTAGYALWTLQQGGFAASETIDPVVDWLRSQQQEPGNWKRSSDRPPSEASHFTTTYLALRALSHVAHQQHSSDTAERFARSRDWLIENTAADTEDRVFRLLALQLVQAGEDEISAAAAELLAKQLADGGWAQLDSLASDAYATGTALFALHRSGQLQTDQPAYQNGINFLLSTQREDGSWHVKSRSVPFQAYYETGFPHGKDQFISTSATAWATLALLLTQPEAGTPDAALGWHRSAPLGRGHFNFNTRG
jgi:hypothetical protein